MNYWSILGIEQTADARAIKRAYAAQLRLHHPEDDPEGFMRVRTAYEQALNYAEYMSRTREQQSYEPDTADDSDEPVETFDPYDPYTEYSRILNPVPQYDRSDKNKLPRRRKSPPKLNGESPVTDSISAPRTRSAPPSLDTDDSDSGESEPSPDDAEDESAADSGGAEEILNRIKPERDDTVEPDADNTEELDADELFWRDMRANIEKYEHFHKVPEEIEALYSELAPYYRMHELYHDFRRRVDVNEWQSLFDGYNAREHMFIIEVSATFFNEHYVLPFKIWELLDTELDLSANRKFTRRSCMSLDYDIAELLTAEYRDMYDSEFDIAVYARLCVDAFLARDRGLNFNAEEYARQCFEMRTDDIRILNLLAECLNAKGDRRGTAEFYERVLELQSNADALRLHIAEIWFELGEYAKCYEHVQHATIASDRAYELRLKCELARDFITQGAFNRGMRAQQRLKNKESRAARRAANRKNNAKGMTGLFVFLFISIVGMTVCNQTTNNRTSTTGRYPTPYNVRNITPYINPNDLGPGNSHVVVGEDGNSYIVPGIAAPSATQPPTSRPPATQLPTEPTVYVRLDGTFYVLLEDGSKHDVELIDADMRKRLLDEYGFELDSAIDLFYYYTDEGALSIYFNDDGSPAHPDPDSGNR